MGPRIVNPHVATVATQEEGAQRLEPAEHLQGEIAQIAQDQVVFAGQGEDVRGGGLVVAAETRRDSGGSPCCWSRS